MNWFTSLSACFHFGSGSCYNFLGFHSNVSWTSGGAERKSCSASCSWCFLDSFDGSTGAKCQAEFPWEVAGVENWVEDMQLTFALTTTLFKWLRNTSTVPSKLVVQLEICCKSFYSNRLNPYTQLTYTNMVGVSPWTLPSLAGFLGYVLMEWPWDPLVKAMKATLIPGPCCRRYGRREGLA